MQTMESELFPSSSSECSFERNLTWTLQTLLVGKRDRVALTPFLFPEIDDRYCNQAYPRRNERRNPRRHGELELGTKCAAKH